MDGTKPTSALLDRDCQRHFIDGQWVDGAEGFDTYNPSTGQVLSRLARGTAEDADRAVRAAQAAFEGPWSRMTPSDRQAIMLRFADLIEENIEELVVLDTLEMGAPVARLPIMKARSPGVIRYYAALARTIRGETIRASAGPDVFTYTEREPVGVVAAIIPWNAPMPSALIKIGPVLATGCTMVMKPSEDASLSIIRLVELLEEAGLPKGVVNLITGYGVEVGAALANHPGVDKIAFTGSTMTGRLMIEASKSTFKRLSLELGGKSPDILFADADLDKAVPGAAMAVFANSGQICSSGTRLFVHKSIAGEVEERLAAFTRTLKVGQGMDPATQLGPIASERQMTKVLGYLDSARTEGATAAAGGTRLTDGGRADGYFVAPTVLANVADGMTVAREKIFGPVLSMLTFEDEAEVIARANATDYGLGGGVWTRDLGRAHRVSRRLRTGTVWVNTYGLMDPSVPMGGFGASGVGREYGAEHIHEYMETRSVWINAAE
ncbi:MAG: aldehyde dehydrogenase family protein [Qingshengfaniella sp.]